MAYPRQGEVWIAELEPAAQRRPVLVVSVDDFNRTEQGRVIVASVVKATAGGPFDVVLEAAPPLVNPSWVRCDALHALPTSYLAQRLGKATSETWTAVEDRVLRLLFAPRPEP